MAFHLFSYTPKNRKHQQWEGVASAELRSIVADDAVLARQDFQSVRSRLPLTETVVGIVVEQQTALLANLRCEKATLVVGKSPLTCLSRTRVAFAKVYDTC